MIWYVYSRKVTALNLSTSTSAPETSSASTTLTTAAQLTTTISKTPVTETTITSEPATEAAITTATETETATAPATDAAIPRTTTTTTSAPGPMIFQAPYASNTNCLSTPNMSCIDLKCQCAAPTKYNSASSSCI
ncbi:hypothetical protein DPMN_151812 [Dreissena polymorpha]|uniref:Uncharacterized protein n=1 Tax=Dreissena polymorpha TaxID=45954 RepID=A0A9D4FG33_DREPO|nr:hypothetical protein DPMN_151812 [Dreissena polymorpha]